jgi:hypothetical protein
MFAGQAPITGFSVSFTVTVNVQALVLPAASVAVQVTVVTPLLKVEPLGGRHSTEASVQLSVAVGAGQFTLAVQTPASVLCVMFAGQTTLGFSVSATVTLKVHEAVFPLASVARQVTGVVPKPKLLPLDGVHA